jgi:hypothetical protein
MIDKTAPSDLSAGMDFDTRCRADELLKNARGEGKAGAVQLVAQPMQEDGVESWIAEENFDGALRGGIATEDGIDLFPEGAEHASNIYDYRIGVGDSEFGPLLSPCSRAGLQFGG